MPSPGVSPQRILSYIMLAVLVWGGLLALGAYLYGGARQGLKAAVILGCVVAFLGLWSALLAYRANLRHNAAESSSPPKERPPGEP